MRPSLLFLLCSALSVWAQMSGTPSYLILRERTAPAASANQVRLYSKDVAGVSHVFARYSDGTEVDLGDTGAGTFGETSLAGLVNSQTLWNSANATRTLTIGLSGATDPILTFANNSISFNVPLTFSGAQVFPDDVRQTFNPGATVAGINVGGQAGNPSTLVNGDLWYDSTANQFKGRANGATISLGAGSGDFVGPASSTDNAVVRFDGTTGKLGQNSLVTISDTGDVNITGALDVQGVSVFSSTALFGQDVTVSGDLDVQGEIRSGGSSLGAIEFGDSDGSHVARIAAPGTITTNGHYTLPTEPRTGWWRTTLSQGTNAPFTIVEGIYREIWIPGGAITPATTNGAALGTNTVGPDGLTLDVLDFDDTTQEAAWFHISMPDGWDRGTVKAKFYWTTTSGTGGVQWGIAGGAVSDDDTLNAAILGTEVEVTDTRLADHDMHVSAATAAITIGGTPALNDWVGFRVRRDPADANDTKTGDARLIGVKLQYLETLVPAAW